MAFSRRPSRQASLQYRTSSHTFAHFFRQAKGRPQAAQGFSGRCGLRWATAQSPRRISERILPVLGSTISTRAPSARSTQTASRPSTPAIPPTRVPAGWCRARSGAGNASAARPKRWTMAKTSATVASTIITPMTTTSILSPRTEPSAETITLTASTDEAGTRADRYLAGAIGSLSRSRVKALMEAGQASRDGRPLTDPSEPVRAGSVYTLVIPPPESATPVAQDIPLTILFEDRHLIVLDKPAGLVVHPAPGNLDGTLVNALLSHAGDDLTGIGGEKRPGIVHRLDKETSGVMVVAKTDAAHQALSVAFATRDLDREYMALCWGVPSPLAGEVDAPIGRHPTDRKRMAVVTRGGKAALTHYRTLKAWGAACSLVHCKLATGRTHQIRVHMAQINHPLVGDPVYLRRTPAAARGLPAELRDALLAFPRQALHARSLAFRHPVTGEPLAFSTEPPADFKALLGLLESVSE